MTYKKYSYLTQAVQQVVFYQQVTTNRIYRNYINSRGMAGTFDDEANEVKAVGKLLSVLLPYSEGNGGICHAQKSGNITKDGTASAGNIQATVKVNQNYLRRP